LLFSLNLSSIIAATVTIGVDIYSGATFIATAIVRAANATCDNPSPIIEYLFKTKLTPNKAEHKATKPPTIIALTINVYDIISLNTLINLGTSYKSSSYFTVSIIFCISEEFDVLF